MRTLVAAAATVVLATLTSSCSGGGDPGGPGDRPSTSTTDEPTPPEPSDAPPPGSGDVDVVDSEACAEVRAGIDAFNLGDYDETVEHFQLALPLAQGQDDGSVPASQLVEAVRYYAELAAGSYPDAARSSPAFAKYKAITLGQCVPVGSETPTSPESPDQDV